MRPAPRRATRLQRLPGAVAALLTTLTASLGLAGCGSGAVQNSAGTGKPASAAAPKFSQADQLGAIAVAKAFPLADSYLNGNSVFANRQQAQTYCNTLTPDLQHKLSAGAVDCPAPGGRSFL